MRHFLELTLAPRLLSSGMTLTIARFSTITPNIRMASTSWIGARCTNDQ
jgi:hypothetical protein